LSSPLTGAVSSEDDVDEVNADRQGRGAVAYVEGVTDGTPPRRLAGVSLSASALPVFDRFAEAVVKDDLIVRATAATAPTAD
jgi:hypothetical protein